MITYTNQTCDQLARLYRPDKTFKAVISIKYYHNYAYMFGAFGEINKKDLVSIVRTMKSKGVDFILLERTKEHKLTSGVLTHEGGFLNLWLIDLRRFNGSRITKCT